MLSLMCSIFIGAAMTNRSASQPSKTPTTKIYKPSDKEPYMNPTMLSYFKTKLEAWKESVLAENDATLQELKEEGGLQEPDVTDRASIEADVALGLRARDRQRKLIGKIDEALERIRNGDYGYCEETGEPIGVRRLEARPIATLTVEAQERHERLEKTQRDDRE